MPNTNRTHHKKRHGLHHKQGKHYHKVYLPYLPAIIMLIASLLFSGLRLPINQSSTLAYATEMSHGGLLESTNRQRTAHSRQSLSLNDKLNAAAQAKANDMATRNYWSHNTPDGQEPWIFIDQAGYSYLKAGENLAYGFPGSSQTVVGWMNSASHKANLLDENFTEVGFGFANSSNFQNNGEETVVVAMYGQPSVLASSGASQQSHPPLSEPSTSSEVPAPTPDQPVNSDSVMPEKISEQQISRVQTLTGGRAPWALFAVGLMSGTAVTGLFINHGLRLRKLIRRGEMFVLHHPAFDINMISIIVLALTLSQRIGVIL